MKQKTAKTEADVHDWIETTPHHAAAKEGGDLGDAFLVLKGHDAKLRIPAWLRRKIGDRIRPGGEFDRRMFRWVGEPPEGARHVPLRGAFVPLDALERWQRAMADWDRGGPEAFEEINHAINRALGGHDGET